MFRFARREPVELVTQTPVAEPPTAAPSMSQELAGIDQKLTEQVALDRADRDPELIDNLLADRSALARAIVPVNPGPAS